MKSEHEEPTNPLNPTLWRTCRALAGQTRVALLQQVLEHPERNVSEMAKAIGIGESAASQDLRRLQSRGLLRREHKGSAVIYRPIPDPQVPSASSLLSAIKKSLSSSPEQKAEMVRIAKAFSHDRRIQILHVLMQHPKSRVELLSLLHIRSTPLKHHLRFLLDSGCVQQEGRLFLYNPTKHPLFQALVKLTR